MSKIIFLLHGKTMRIHCVLSLTPYFPPDIFWSRYLSRRPARRQHPVSLRGAHRRLHVHDSERRVLARAERVAAAAARARASRPVSDSAANAAATTTAADGYRSDTCVAAATVSSVSESHADGPGSKAAECAHAFCLIMAQCVSSGLLRCGRANV
jgi:hypothetical protein